MPRKRETYLKNEKNRRKRQAKQLGMSFGAACHRLRKQINFHLVQQLGLDVCYKCGKKIEDIDQFSIEHKTPWRNSEHPVELFFDMNNIAYSHLSCNVSDGERASSECGTANRYKRGCRCQACKAANTKKQRDRRARRKAEIDGLVAE